MIRPTPLWRSAAVLGVAGLVLTACGGSSDTASTSRQVQRRGIELRARGREGRRHAEDRHAAAADRCRSPSSARRSSPAWTSRSSDINDAGGVNGKQVEKVDSDSGDTSTDTAVAVGRPTALATTSTPSSAPRRPASRSRVIDKITGAGVLQISPANTSDELTDYADKGLYFRTAPSDVLQGRVARRPDPRRRQQHVGILALQDSYGTGLRQVGDRGDHRRWRPGRRAGRLRPQGRVLQRPRSARSRRPTPTRSSLIAFDETKKIIPELVKQGIGPTGRRSTSSTATPPTTRRTSRRAP